LYYWGQIRHRFSFGCWNGDVSIEGAGQECHVRTPQYYHMLPQKNPKWVLTRLDTGR